ncbi:translocation/assembly module TamB domain-containing protein [Marilutibacter aestuarii]|uniref:Translocation/assembly module TamB n=1 Tax=Marilutibacter aestuarii TaxID=1706195 RepID=A0A508AA33_9GAMM|nr:translocation/assembly module TamB domain-containing protein [Lysobacter aestuarii]TQD45401.1 translocation/assembly module TamB [Lysobacter aestuarii]
MARPPVPATPQPTPEEREARIRELRQRRRARMRVLAVRTGLVAAGLGLLAGGLLYWLLSTVGGRDLLLGQVVARLPPNARLEWRDAEGPVAGPMTLHGLRFEMDGLVFNAERATLDPAIRPLIGRTLRLDALQLEGASLQLPLAEDTPFELPRWPDVLPAIEPPLALEADDVQVDGLAVSRLEQAVPGRAVAAVPLIDIRRLRGGLRARSGVLELEGLEVASDRGRFAVDGEYRPGDDYRTDLVATAVLPAPRGRTPARIGLVARGDLARMDVGIGGAVPGPLRATATLRGESPVRWTLDVRADAVDPGLLAGSDVPAQDPLVVSLAVEGEDGEARLRGNVRQGTLAARLLPSTLRLRDQVLELDPLVLETLDGRVRAQGRGDFSDPADPRVRLALNARGITWTGAETAPGEPAPVAIVGNADLGVAGTLQAWAAVGRATLTRDGEQATVDFDGRGDERQMRLERLEVAMPTGTLDVDGELHWTPTLGWTAEAALAGFDPGYFAADWPGAVDGRVRSEGELRDPGGLRASVVVDDLGGRLRDRPLDGKGHVEIDGESYRGELALRLGGSRIEAKGRVADTLDVDARFMPLQLADLLPAASGTLQGRVRLGGAPAAPDIEAELRGSGLRYGDYSAQSMSVQGRLPWRRGEGALALRASGLEAGVALDHVRVDARGAVEALSLDAEAQGDIGQLALAGQARKQGNAWQGELARLRLAPARGAQWQLQQAAGFRWDGGNGRLDPACLASSAGGRLCANADWPRRGLSVQGEALPLLLIEPYLPERGDGRPWVMRGEVALDAQLRPAGNAWQGHVELSSPSGGFKFRERAQREPFNYSDLSLSAQFDPTRIEATLDSTINQSGRLAARLQTGWDAYAPLSGSADFNIDELVWLELFSPDLLEPQGRLSGNLTVSGTRAEPRLGGQARLADFTTELPALGIVLQDGQVDLVAQGDGTARIDGRIRSSNGDEAGGVLDIDGVLGWRGGAPPLQINVRGDNVLVSDTRDLRAVASPDLQIRIANDAPVTVTGKVAVPSALLDLERLDGAVSPSADVVVLDPVDPEKTGSTPLELDLDISLGDDVRLNGFGLKGRLGGQMRVRSTPGREMTARGALTVAGRYKAYGQDLTITRGTLSWSGGPVSDPILDIRAEREIGDVTAGVDIGGRVGSPSVEVWSDPASTQSEALSYLTLGRPLSSASDSESEQLSAANAALSAGGSVLASQLGTRLGLDDAGVMQSRTAGGVFGFGKRISPRLYVGYGVSLLGNGTVLTLKYLLGKGFDVEIESGSEESRGYLNWRKEK